MSKSNIIDLNGSPVESTITEEVPVDEIIESFPHKPLDNRVLILPDPMPTKTKGGIEIPDSAKIAMNRGTVIATGPGRISDDGSRLGMDIKPGDHVMLDVSTRTQFLEWEGRSYLIIYDHQVSLVLNP